MNDDKDSGFFAAIEWKKWMLGSLIALIPLFLVVNDRYLAHFDSRYILRSEALTIVQSEKMAMEVATTKQMATENRLTLATNAKNLDELSHDVSQLTTSFEAYAAVATVSNLRQALDRKEREPENVRTVNWIEERDRLKRQVKQAEDRRDCLLAQRLNCHLLSPDGG